MTVSVKRGSAEVLDALYRLLLKHGKPEDIRSDNGPDLIAASLHKGLIRTGIKPIRITPGSPWENGDNERFNGRLCREGLNAEGVNTTRAGSDCHQSGAQAVQSYPPASGTKPTSTKPPDLIRNGHMKSGLDSRA